jgi:hypothetical protein
MIIMETKQQYKYIYPNLKNKSKLNKNQTFIKRGMTYYNQNINEEEMKRKREEYILDLEMKRSKFIQQIIRALDL